MGCTESNFEQFTIENFVSDDADVVRPPRIEIVETWKPERTLSQEAPSSAEHDKRGKKFWAEQDYWAVELKKEKRKSVKKKKKTDWKFLKEKPEVLELCCAANIPRERSVTVHPGKLKDDIRGHEARKSLLELAHLEDKQKLTLDVRAMKMKRELSLKKLSPEEFKAAQEAVSRALLKRPQDYEYENAEDTGSLIKELKLMFRDNDSKPMTGAKKEKFVNLLHTAGVLNPESARVTSNVKYESQLLEINMNASQFLHSTNELLRDSFVSSICELIETERTFEQVKFSYGQLKENHIVELASSLEKCKNLKHVYLDSNDFGNKGIRALIKVLHKNKESLVTLSIQNLPVWQTPSTEVLNEFVEAIEGSSSLIRLGFDMKEFRHLAFMDRVSKHLQKNFDRLRKARLNARRSLV